MSDDTITELLHSNLDSPELRIESEKRVCQQIVSSQNNGSVCIYIVAVFEYCLNRPAEQWPLNAIKAISGLAPEAILQCFEDKIDHFRHMLIIYFTFVMQK